MGTVAADAIQLEAKRKEDSSWHPCQVSLSSDTSTSFGLMVDFESLDCEEAIFTKEEALARLRIRSTPLQGDDCSQIKEGEHVLASQETKLGILFFDAKVEKVCRVRHSKRSQCRCTFQIKWLYLRPGAGSVTVPASSIMKLTTSTVDRHTTVAEFLNSVDTFDCAGVSSIVSLLEETIFGSDLEKQIEEISRLAEVCEKGNPEGFPQLKKVDLTAQVRHRTIASQVSFLHDQGPREQNNSRRTTRSRKKIQEESEKIQPPPQLVAEESDRIHLSPLGARAALASLMYKLPPEPEFSAYDGEREGLTSAAQSTMTNSVVRTKFVDSVVHTQEVSMKDSLLSSEDCPVPVVPKHAKVRTSARRDTSKKFLQTTEMQNGLEKSALTPNDTKEEGSSIVTVKRSLTCSPSDTKSEGPKKTSTRLTRYTIQKGIGLSNDEIELKPSEEMKLCSPTHTHAPRFTRSTIQKQIRNVTVVVHKGLQESRLAQDTESSLTCLTNKKGTGHSNDEIELKPSVERKLRNPTHTPRFTRSAIQKEARDVTLEVNKVLEESNLAQGTRSGFTREDLVTPRTKETKRKNLLPSPSNDEINFSIAQESQKKQRVSNDIRITRSEGEISQSGACLQVDEKSVLSKTKPKLRFSPRLGSTPRTRSQQKSS